MRFNKDSASGDDTDVMGVISFYGTDASNNTHEKLAYMDAIITDSVEGSEASSLRFFVAENDANLTIGLKIDGQADNDGEVDVTIGAGAGSTTTIEGTLTMGSTAALTNTGLVAVANQSNITGLGTISSGVWQGTAIASAYLDADTAHLSGTQTFTGDKIFSSGSLTESSALASEPKLHITNTHSGDTSGELRFNKDSSSGADSDVMGVISVSYTHLPLPTILLV